MIDTILLVGGFGTRLKDISDDLPKALMPIGSKVFLDIIIDRIIGFNINKIYLSTHYRSELFDNYVLNHPCKDKIECIREPSPMGTGGAISHIIKNTNISSPFFTINGDTMSNLNLNMMYQKFLKKKCNCMIGISKVNNAARYGLIEIRNQKIISFNEKNEKDEGWINNGHYIFDKSIFSGYLGKYSLEKEFFPSLIKIDNIIPYKVINDNFIDIGIPADYYSLCSRY